MTREEKKQKKLEEKEAARLAKIDNRKRTKSKNKKSPEA